MGFTRNLCWMALNRRRWCARLVFPNGVNWIGHRHKSDHVVFGRLMQRLQLTHGVKPGVKSNMAGVKVFHDPRARQDLGPIHRRVAICHLLFDLRAVAAINKYASDVF